MKRIISVVTPSFNQGSFIGNAIKSVLSQAGEFYIDYIIMDGGSSDETVEVITQYEALLKQHTEIEILAGLRFYKPGDKESDILRCLGISFRWVSKKDFGQSWAINRGFDQAGGSVFCWMNSDDFYLDGAFQVALEAMKEDEIDVVVGNTKAIDSEGKLLWCQYPEVPSIMNLLYRHRGPQQPAMFFKADLLRKVSGLNESLNYVMDVDLWCKFLFSGAKFYKVDRFLAIQVYHPKAKSCQGSHICAVFEPEDKSIKAHYRKKLGWKHYLFVIQRAAELMFPQKAIYSLTRLGRLLR